MESSLLLLLSLLPVLLAAPGVSAVPASPGKPRSTCQSLECVELAAGMATRMNPAIDPCEDFYSYACGNFPKTVPFHMSHLYKDTSSLMEEKIKKQSSELLLLNSNVTDSDPDIQDLYRLTRLFFHSCDEWIRVTARNAGSSDEPSAGFFKAIFNGLMQSIREELSLAEEGAAGLHSDPSISSEANKRNPSRKIGQGEPKLQLEVILAAMVRAGGRGLISVMLRHNFALEALKYGFDLTKVVRATVELSYQRWRGSYSQQFVTFFTSNNITSGLSLDHVSSRFGEVTRGLERDEESWKSRASECTKLTIGGHSDSLMTIADLDQLSACVNKQNPFSWKLFFETLLRSSINTNERIYLSDPLKLIFVANFYKRQPVYSGTDSTKFSSHVSYLMFDWLLSYEDFFPGVLRQTWHKHTFRRFMGTIKGRLESCKAWTTTYMLPVFERMYRVAYHPEGFSKFHHLIELIKNASVKSVRSQDWIDGRTKEAIVDKIRHMTHRIGLNDLTNQHLKEYYSEALNSFRALTISMDNLDRSFGSLLSIVLRAHNHRSFDIMSGGRNATLFLAKKSLSVGAFNFKLINKILLPMGLLQPPVYHHSYPDYINLGAIGMVTGHEIGHAFASASSHIAGMTDFLYIGHPTDEGYREREACVGYSYGNYRLFPGGPRHKSWDTVNEDISDILGLKAAFGALQMVKQSQGNMQWLPNMHTELNQDQLFFVSAAQFWCSNINRDNFKGGFYRAGTHSPNPLRVRGSMQNSWEFARAFKCRPGQPMNPRRKCTFW